MSKYAFLRSNASLIVLGLALGLVCGFKIANTQYRSQQGEALKRDIARASSERSGQQAEVSAIIEKARANPNDVDAQIDAAAQFIQIERPQEAMPFLEQARKANQNDPRVNAALGVAHFMMGQFDQAIDALKRSQEQGADSPVVSTFLIGSYIQTRKNLDEAERLLKQLEAQNIDPPRLAQIRADLDAARRGSNVNQGASPSEKNGESPKPKTTLSHGPEQPKIAK